LTSPAGQRRGLMLVLSSPSGAGKTTMSKRLLASDQHISLSVSATTRPPRAGEVDGRDYHFVSPEAFDDLISGNHLLEWAHVFNNRYGTPRAPVDAALKQGSDVLFDIDWQGTQQLRESARGADLVSVFLLPPSMGELHRRLQARAADSAEVIATRMARAADEISHWAEYDYVLLNDDLDRCQAEIRAILTSERLKRTRQVGVAAFVRNLLAGEQSGPSA